METAETELKELLQPSNTNEISALKDEIKSLKEIVKKQNEELIKVKKRERFERTKEQEIQLELDFFRDMLRTQMSRMRNISLANLNPNFSIGNIDGWYLWRDLKEELKSMRKELHSKNYNDLFKEVDFKKDIDYKLILSEGKEYPICVINPNSVGKLMARLNISIYDLAMKYLIDSEELIGKFNMLFNI
jgi:hypothetical protein